MQSPTVRRMLSYRGSARSISLVTVYLRCAKAADTTVYTHEVRPSEVLIIVLMIFFVSR